MRGLLTRSFWIAAGSLSGPADPPPIAWQPPNHLRSPGTTNSYASHQNFFTHSATRKFSGEPLEKYVSKWFRSDAINVLEPMAAAHDNQSD